MPPSTDGRPPDNRHPVEKALDHLAKTFPLKTPEWTAWSANMRPARLDGTWALSGWELGKGAIYGRVTITADPSSPEEFTTSATYRVARTGETITRTGRAIVYTGFQWRGRSSHCGGRFVDARSDDGRSRLADDGRPLVHGRLRRDRHRREAGARRRRDARARHRSHRAASRARPASSSRSTASTSASLRPRDIDLGPGSPSRASSRDARCRHRGGRCRGHRVARHARSVRRRRVAAEGARGVRQDRQHQGEARLGDGARRWRDVPEDARAVRSVGVQQRRRRQARFARTTSSSGMVDAAWSMEEYAATYDDDDIKFVGTLNEATGRFTPNVDGPNPARVGSRNNIGDVWVVAKYLGEAVARQAGADAPRARPPARHRAAVHAFRSVEDRNEPVSAFASSIRSRRPAAGSCTWCRAPRCSRSTIARRPSSIRSPGPAAVDELTRELSARFDAVEVTDTIAELQRVRALGELGEAARRCRRSFR